MARTTTNHAKQIPRTTPTPGAKKAYHTSLYLVKNRTPQ